MKPNYALSLSLDGIRFLCRVDGGWHLLGEVPLEHRDLDTALADLRKLGEDHAGEDALCKIILPDDQIRYLTLEDFDGDQDEAIAEALADATPYALEDLAYDFVETADGVQVAAVAKETLGEALGFAQEHGFHPVSYTAIPDADQFDAEPFFGATPIAAGLIRDGEVPEPDTEVVDVISKGTLPKEEVEQAPAPSFASSRLLATPSQPAESGSQSEGAASKLGGATRGGDLTGTGAGKAPAVQNGAINTIATQEPRFDPATIIAGLKQSPDNKPGSAKAPGKPSTNQPKAKPVAAAKASTSAKGSPKLAPSDPTVGGKPKFLGVILVLILMAFLAGVAVWASIFTDDGVSGFFKPGNDVEIIPLEPTQSEDLETTALPPVSNHTITDSAEIEAMDDAEGILIDPVMEAALPTPTSDALYAATGIWDRSPVQPDTPNSDTSEAIYLASFEPMQQTHDAIALPTPESFGIDPLVAQQNNPVPAGTVIDLDARGLVVATAEGAISPEGIMVYLGKPAALPASFPDRVAVQEATQEEAQEEVQAEVSRLATFRPKARPGNLVEQNERATLGGSTLSEIAGIRPRVRPEGLVKVVSIDPSSIQEATDQAVVASIRPRSRPKNFASTVKKQQERMAAVAVPRNESVAPSIPTTASVARNATQDNAINLRKVNLIGVYGASNDRRALVRLSSGRYKKVKIGDRLNGGRVAAISGSELHYVKSGRTVVLKMPRG